MLNTPFRPNNTCVPNHTHADLYVSVCVAHYPSLPKGKGKLFMLVGSNWRNLVKRSGHLLENY